MAVQVLYESELTGVPAWEIAERSDAVPDGGSLPEYADMLIKGIESHGSQIDVQLSNVSKDWSIDRMPITDRAIMRLAVFEMAYVDDVPVSVSINEAVELAKDFGAEDESSRFINGVLGRIARKLEDAEFKGSTPPETLAADAKADAEKREAERRQQAAEAAQREREAAEARYNDGYGSYDDYDDYHDRDYRNDGYRADRGYPYRDDDEYRYEDEAGYDSRYDDDRY